MFTQTRLRTGSADGRVEPHPEQERRGAAAAPIASWRSPRRNGGPPDRTPTVAPVIISASPVSTAATRTARIPSMPNRNGSTGISAPRVKNRKLDHAAVSRCRRPLLRGTGESDTGRPPAPQHRARPALGLRGGHPPGPIHQRELVRVDVESETRLSPPSSGLDAASSSRCELTEMYSPAAIDSAPANSPDSPVSSTVLGRWRPHRSPRGPARCCSPARRRRRTPRPASSRTSAPPPRRQPANHLAVDPLVGQHRRRHVPSSGQRPAFGLLHQRQHEHPTESPCQDGREPLPKRGGPGRAH